MHHILEGGKRSGRYAPSPSGRMHLGNVFSALMAWAISRSADDTFYIRMDNLDERSRKPEYAQQVLDDLAWLGFDWDGDAVYQSSRLDSYKRAMHVLEECARVYPCFCTRADLHAANAPHLSDGTPLYSGVCRSLAPEQVLEKSQVRDPAMRIEVPDTAVFFEDLHEGSFSQHLADECGDFVLQRSDGVFAYQLASVVDDCEMGIGVVVRGRDLLSSTPRQIWLARLLGYEPPEFFHHPVLLAPDGRRLSKRDKDCDMGFIRSRLQRPERLIGLLAMLMGQVDSPMSHPVEMTAGEFLQGFDAARVPAGDITVDVSALLRL